jgi:hypothetical protein
MIRRALDAAALGKQVGLGNPTLRAGNAEAARSAFATSLAETVRARV